ncbi:MAG: hypothetical protein ACM336_09235, partial [Acidobacteriota bacterium]
DGFTVTFESTSLPGMPSEHLVFWGTKGKLWISRLRFEFTPSDPSAKPIVFEHPDTLVESHIRNFLDCCRTRKRPNCGPEHGDRASRACLLATEAYEQKRRIRADEIDD